LFNLLFGLLHSAEQLNARAIEDKGIIFFGEQRLFQELYKFQVADGNKSVPGASYTDSRISLHEYYG
jgi:hypothetical protein